jgi:signal transduction histidine kinase
MNEHKARPKWHLVYFALAAFDLLAIAVSLYVNHRIMGIYTESVTANRTWTERLKRYADLDILATHVRAPGAEVFVSHDVEAEAAKMQSMHRAFSAERTAAIAELKANAPADEAKRLLRDFDAAGAAMEEMTADARMVFSFLRENNTAKARQSMIEMDRKFIQVDALDDLLTKHVGEIQTAHLNAQHAVAESLRQWEYVLAGLVAMMVVGAAVYGWKLSQRVGALFDEKELHIEQIRQFNEELERRVIDRTAQLEASNKELEAFSYSVSHDLRAPLRGIDGFSRILLEEYGPKLDPEAQRYLGIVREATKKMGQLVDELLAFSRLGRQQIAKQRVATEAIVRETLVGLEHEHDGRRVELRVGHLPPCDADPALLKQVYMNLLGNALKYTRRRECAVIEIGCATHSNGADELRYFVKDNGVGFDMKYAHKLFGVFQRLHRAEDYEGTGVGLAIAQRIIHRHGGRIWAESAPDNGATFYFTLEGNKKP